MMMNEIFEQDSEKFLFMTRDELIKEIRKYPESLQERWENLADFWDDYNEYWDDYNEH